MAAIVIILIPDILHSHTKPGIVMFCEGVRPPLPVYQVRSELHNDADNNIVLPLIRVSLSKCWSSVQYDGQSEKSANVPNCFGTVNGEYNCRFLSFYTN